MVLTSGKSLKQFFMNGRSFTNIFRIKLLSLSIFHSYSIPYLPHNDIALVRVDKSFEFSKNIQPIKFSKMEIPDDAILTVTGFEQTTTTNTEIFDALQSTAVKRINMKECNPPTDPLVFGDGHLCTLSEISAQKVCFGNRWGRQRN